MHGQEHVATPVSEKAGTEIDQVGFIPWRL